MTNLNFNTDKTIAYLMPAGDTRIYYGVEVNTENLCQILNIEYDDDLDFYDNEKELSVKLKKNKYKGELESIKSEHDDENPIQFIIYGYQLVEYFVFGYGEFDFDQNNYKKDLTRFKTKYKIDADPKFYCCYAGD